MKFCQSHWNRLQKAIDSRGMSGLVAKDGKECVQRQVKQLEGDEDLSNFDPLMAAHWGIVNKFMEPLGVDGLYIMNGDLCPLCELVKLNPSKHEIDANWINGVSRDLQQYCMDKGLIAVN